LEAALDRWAPTTVHDEQLADRTDPSTTLH
jgi:hypothetical protein